jgi:diguanylate cyclase (GGDEF)-like protein
MGGFVGLDAGTLMTAIVVVCGAIAGLLALSWTQNRSVPAYGIWTLCFLLCTAAAAIAAARHRLPGHVAIDMANALRLLAYGLAWQAARGFTDRGRNWPLALAPAVLWLAILWLSPPDDMRTRVLVTTPLVAAYAFALAAELWRIAPSRWGLMPLAAIIVSAHGAVFVVRFFMALFVPNSVAAADIGIAAPLHPLGLLEMLGAAVVLSFLLLSIAKEAVGNQHRVAALLDPLTGISNRRGFTDEVGRMLARAGRNGSWTALILIDLDQFKAVNDGWGHPTGDRLLKALTDTMSEVIRAGDVLSRLGGDEFAVALAESRIEQALVLAERLRRAVAGLKIESGRGEVSFTVSIGVASLRGEQSLDTLMGEADAALYRAKSAGGNRVEFSIDRRGAAIERSEEGTQERRRSAAAAV